MFKRETILRVIYLLKSSIAQYRAMNPIEINPSISSGNRKIGRVMNFSIAPVLTCGSACKHCMGYCYDIKACLQYPNNVVNARAKNTVLVLGGSVARDHLFGMIDDKMSRRRTNKFFRWHVAGDIVDIDYFARMVDNARKHPDFTIWTYTKQYHIVNEYVRLYGRDAIPANFTIMFSEWRGLPMNNPYKFPEFRVIFKGEEVPEDASWICPGNCDVCKACGRGCVNNETTYAHEH